MNYKEFTESLQHDTPPDKVNDLLLALWHERKGDWENAHNIVQDIHTRDASWIHAYLHRKEGDPGNAAYWYNRAGRPVATTSLDD